ASALGLFLIAGVCTLACHAEQNFPVSALTPARLTPGIEWFEVSTAGLEDERTVTDLSSLNPEPAGAHGFVRAERGHFVDDRGARVPRARRRCVGSLPAGQSPRPLSSTFPGGPERFCAPLAEP